MRQDGLISREQAKKEVGAINSRQEAARTQLADAPEADPGCCQEQLGTLIEVWGSADAGQRNTLLSEVVKSISVNQTDFETIVMFVPKPAWFGFLGRP